MQRWIKATVLSIGAKAESVVMDRTTKAANDILKVHQFLMLIKCSVCTTVINLY